MGRTTVYRALSEACVKQTIERAFELARSGTCADVADIRRALKKERYPQIEEHLRGQAVCRQLRDICLEARRAPD